MPKMKGGKLGLLLILAMAGAGYFSTFSSLDLPFGLQNYLILVPVQLGTAAYFLWFRKEKPSLPPEDQA